MNTMADPLASIDAWGIPRSPPPTSSLLHAEPSLESAQPSNAPSSSSSFYQPQTHQQHVQQREQEQQQISQPQMQRRQTQPQGKFLRVKVMALERNRKDLLIRFDANTNLPNFRTSLYKNVQRSYVEFQQFAEQLASGNPQAIVPALPLPTTSALTDDEDDRLVRIALQRWFTRVCEDPVLIGTGGAGAGEGIQKGGEEVRSFVESDFGYQPVIRHNSSSQPARSLSTTPISLTAISSATTSTSSFGLSTFTKLLRRGPLDEDEDLSTARAELESLENKWGHVAANVGAIGKGRRTLAVAQADTGGKIAAMSTVEVGNVFGGHAPEQLALAYKKIGKAWENAAGLQQAQAVSDNVVLSDSLGYQALNARAAKETLNHRTQVLEDAQSASKVAINKRRTVERLKGSSNINPAKVDDAIEEMREAAELDQQLADKVSAISINLRQALQTHSRQAHDDAVMILLEHARTKIMYEKQVLKDLEALRPDVRSIGKVPAVNTPSVSVAQQSLPRQGRGNCGDVDSGAPAGYSQHPPLASSSSFASPSKAHATPPQGRTAVSRPAQDPMSASVPSLPSNPNFKQSNDPRYPSFTPYASPANLARAPSFQRNQPQPQGVPPQLVGSQQQPPLQQQYQQSYPEHQQVPQPYQQPPHSTQPPFQQSPYSQSSYQGQPPPQSNSFPQQQPSMAQSMYVSGPFANAPPGIGGLQGTGPLGQPGPGQNGQGQPQSQLPPQQQQQQPRQGFLKGPMPTHRKGRLNDVAAARSLAGSF